MPVTAEEIRVKLKLVSIARHRVGNPVKAIYGEDTPLEQPQVMAAHEPLVSEPRANVNPFQNQFTPSPNVKSMGEIAADISPIGKENLGFGEKLARGAAAIPVGLLAAAEGVATKPVETVAAFGKGLAEHAAETAALVSSKTPGIAPELAVARKLLQGAEKLNVPIIGQIEPKLRELESQRLERYKQDPIQVGMDVLGMVGLPATAAWAIKASKIIKAVPKNIAEVMAKNATESASATGKVAAQKERAFFELAKESDPTLTKDEAKQWIDAINEYDGETKKPQLAPLTNQLDDIPPDMKRLRREIETEMPQTSVGIPVSGIRARGGGSQDFRGLIHKVKGNKQYPVDPQNHQTLKSYIDAHTPLYHGTPVRGLKELDPRKAIETEGATFFTDNPDVAEIFRHPREYGEVMYDSPSGSMLTVYTNIENPLILEGKTAQDFTNDSVLQSRIIKKAKDDGYDGVIAKDVMEGVGEVTELGNTYAVFDKSQILTKDQLKKRYSDSRTSKTSQAGATGGEMTTTDPQKAPSTSPVDELKSQIDAVVPKDVENRLATQRKGLVSGKQNKIPKALEGLAAEARKSKDFDDFERNYLGEIKHGTYWHWTDDPNFVIDPNKGPRDMSSMGAGSADVGKLMVTSDIDAWKTYGPKGKGRAYAVLIDLSEVDPSHYKQVRRGFGNEFFVSDPSKAKVIKVYDRQSALRVDKERAKVIPKSSRELKEFYDSAVGSTDTKSSLSSMGDAQAGKSDVTLPGKESLTTPPVEKPVAAKVMDEYVYHRTGSDPEIVESIKKKGLLRKYAGEYPHGEPDIPDDIPRIYFGESPQKTYDFGGKNILRVKRSVIAGNMKSRNMGLRGEEIWYFGDKIHPSDIEMKINGEWKPLARKRAVKQSPATSRAGKISTEQPTATPDAAVRPAQSTTKVKEPWRKNRFIHETDSDFEHFDINKVGANTGEQWFGRGQYLQEEGTFKFERYGKNKKEYTIPEDVKIFNSDDLVEYADKKGLLPKNLKDKTLTYKSEADLPSGYKLAQSDDGKYYVFDGEGSAVDNVPASDKEFALKRAYNKINEIDEYGNITPKDVFDGIGRERLVAELKKDGYDGFYNGGELVIYNPDKIKLAKPTSSEVTSTQPADAGGTGTPGKSAIDAESAPVSASEGGVPKFTPKLTPKFTQDPDAIGLNKVQIERIRKATGLDELPEFERRSHLTVLQKAKDNGTDRRAMNIAKELKENPRPLSDEEHAGMVLKIEELTNAFRESVDAVDDAVTRGVDPAAARARMKVVEDEINLLTDASDSGGRESARGLNARRMLKSLQTDDIIHVRRQATANKGSKLTEQESAHFEKIVAEKDAALKQLDEVNAKWQKDYDALQAKQADELVRRESNKAKITERSQTKREKIISDRIDILKKLKERGHEVTLNAGVNPEDAYLIGKLAINYVKAGTNNIDEVVRLVMADIPNLTKRDVWQSINSKNPDLQAKAKTVAMRQVNLIRKQAELLTKIEDAEAGIFTKTHKALDTTPAEIKSLQARLRELRMKSYETVRNADRLERTQKAISDVQNQLSNHYRNIKAKKPTEPEALTELQTKLKELRRTMKIEDDLARYEDQLRTGDFEIPHEVVKRKVSPEVERAEIDLKKARRKIKDEIENLRPKTKTEKVVAVAENLRAIKATADLSATLRQGAISVVSHPILAAKNFPKSLQAAFSEFKAEVLDNAMKEGANKYLYDKGKLELSELSGLPTKREEYFAGALVEKIPGLGQVVKASNRHMATFLNLMRTGMFDDFVKNVPNATTQELQAYAKWINVTTGRGDLGRFAQTGRTLGTVFFAPRFAISRLQTPVVFFKSMKASPRVRAQVAKEAVAVTSAALGVLALAKLSGATVGDNPRESDFGKIRIGNERIDIFAGYQQPYRLIAKAAVGATDKAGLSGDWLRNEKTGEINANAEVDPIDDWIQFAMFKLSPQVQLARQLYTGNDVIGQDQSRVETVIRSVVPIMAESIYDAWKEEGVATAARSAGLNLLGVSSNVYPDSSARLKRDLKKAEYDGDQKLIQIKKSELKQLEQKKKGKNTMVAR